MHFSTSISDVLRVQLTKKVEHLGGAVLDGPESSTHFVTLAPVKGDPKTGFRKSIASLLALAAGAIRSIGCRSKSDASEIAEQVAFSTESRHA